MTESVVVQLTRAVAQPDAPADRYERFRPLLLRFFQRRVSVATEAEDLAQEVMIRLLRQPPETQVRHPEAYLFQIAANVLRDQYRRDAARMRDRHEVLVDDPSLMGLAPSEEQLYCDREMLVRLLSALEELTPKCRTVFLLQRYEGLSYSEIARRLGVSQSAIEKHMMSAIRHLHRRLDGD